LKNIATDDDEFNETHPYDYRMKILIVGGTVFLGRHIVDAALAKGHQLTLLHRGQRGADLFANDSRIDRIIADRNGSLEALEGKRFDAVIDTSGYTSAQIHAIADLLGDNVAHYTFVSSISAYDTPPRDQSYNEDFPLAQGNEGYGAQKARAEDAIVERYGQRALIVRPGLIVGPHDPTGRFVYWPLRFLDGGDVLAPGLPDTAIQWIDVRDLAEWIVRCAEAKLVGAFNAITPAKQYSMRDLLDTCSRVAQTNDAPPSRVYWVDDQKLLDAGVEMWTGLPLWIAASDEASGLMLASAARAMNAGLTFRTLEDTGTAALEWARTLPSDDPKLGREKTLSRERERELLNEFGFI
jgi:2'-hydroxyisoflavone reductase